MVLPSHIFFIFCLADYWAFFAHVGCGCHAGGSGISPPVSAALTTLLCMKSQQQVAPTQTPRAAAKMLDAFIVFLLDRYSHGYSLTI